MLHNVTGLAIATFAPAPANAPTEALDEVQLCAPKGTTKAKVSPAVLDFGEVAPGTTTSKSVKVANTGPLTIRLTFGENPDGFEIEAADPNYCGVIAPGDTQHFTVRFTPATAGKQYDETVALNFGSRIVRYHLKGKGKGAMNKTGIEILTPEIDTGDVATDDFKDLSIRLRRTDDQEHFIGVTVTPNPPFVVSPNTTIIPATDGPEFTFDGLTYYARELGDFTGTVTVFESLQAHVVGKVTVHAHSTKNRYSANTAKLQFPDTIVGQNSQLTFQLTDNDHTVSGPDGQDFVFHDPVGAARWSVSGNRLNPGQTGPFTVNFAPTAAGSYTNVLQIHLQSNGKYSTTITLTGNAIQGPRPGRR